MKLPHFIKNKVYKNILRAFANIDEPAYSNEFKSRVLNGFIELSKQTFTSEDLKFDIDGKKIGLSKGSPLIREKALMNKLEKFGYSELRSIATILEKTNKESHLAFFDKINERPTFCEIAFSWDYEDTNNYNTAIDLFKRLSKIVSLEYGYSYLASKNTLLSEWKTNLVGVTYMPNIELDWINKIGSIKTGAIKKIYPINCFNKNQFNKLDYKFDSITPVEESDLRICLLNQ